MGTRRDITCVFYILHIFIFFRIQNCVKYTLQPTFLEHGCQLKDGSELYIEEPVSLSLAHINQPLVS
jgi:hypothetical protein